MATKEEIEKKAESIGRIAQNLIKENTPSQFSPKMVLLEWVDVQSIDGGLLYAEEINFEPVHCFLIGFLVKETETAYYLAKEYWGSGQYKYIHIVPKKTAIISIRSLHL